MFPRTFDETKNAGVNHERIGRIVNRQIILVEIVSSFALPVPILTLNGRDRKICYDFIRENQVKGMVRKIKLRRILLEMLILRKKLSQDLSLILHQSRREIEDVIVDAGPIQAFGLFYKRSRKTTGATANFQHFETRRVVQ